MTIDTLEKLFDERSTFPPYPQDFIIPENIKAQWRYIVVGGRTRAPILEMGKGYFNVKVGNRFNTVVARRKRKTGEKKPFRTFQLRGIYPRLFGYIVKSLSGYRDIRFPRAEGILEANVLKGWQELRSGIVVRVQVLYVNPKEFYCVALRDTFNRANLEDNLVNCNYEKAR